MNNVFSVTVVESWLREKSFRVLFVLFLSIALFLLRPDYFEHAHIGSVALTLFIATTLSYGFLRLSSRRWPNFLRFSRKAPLLKAFLLFIAFLPVCFALLFPLFLWVGWLDEHSRPLHPTQAGIQTMFVGLWYGTCWTPISALLSSWFLCRK